MIDNMTEIKFPYLSEKGFLYILEKMLSCGEISDEAAIKAVKMAFYYKNVVVVSGDDGKKDICVI